MAKSDEKLPIGTEEKNRPAATEAWAPFESLRREIDRVFDSFHHGALRVPFARSAMEAAPSWSQALGWGIAPAVDVSEKDKGYQITAELPGLDEKDIEVTLANGRLTIRGEKKEEKEEREKSYYLSERRYGSFTRSFQVPEGVDGDAITARFAKGVLTVTLPKTAEARKSAKKIAVKAD